MDSREKTKRTDAGTSMREINSADNSNGIISQNNGF